MKAVLYSGDGKLALVDMPRPELRDRLVPKKYREEPLALAAQEQVVLRVEAGSICGSDLHILEGGHPSAPPVMLGHEYVGRAVEVGSAVTHVREGDRVVVDPNIKCGVAPPAVAAGPTSAATSLPWVSSWTEAWPSTTWRRASSSAS